MKLWLAGQAQDQHGTDEVVFILTWPTQGSPTQKSWKGGVCTNSTRTQSCMATPTREAHVLFYRRYPVILRRFGLRSDTGGKGKYRGGDGVVREIMFRKNLTLSVLTERRVHRPYGMNGWWILPTLKLKLWRNYRECFLGGEKGECGTNVLIFVNGRVVNLGSKAAVYVGPGVCGILLRQIVKTLQWFVLSGSIQLVHSRRGRIRKSNCEKGRYWWTTVEKASNRRFIPEAVRWKGQCVCF